MKAKPAAARAPTARRNRDLVRRFGWEVAAIDIYLQDLRVFWGKTLGVSGPQWMILMAVSDLDEGEGVSVKAVAQMMRVDPSFITTNTKLLEKKGLLRRRVSAKDARVVQMSLTDRMSRHLSTLAARQEEIENFIFSEVADDELAQLTERLGLLKTRLEKARFRLEAEL
jgi:DNA-binding MarR family transcriptional regulator